MNISFTQNAPYPASIILFFIFTLVVVFSMIILLLVMVSVSVTCSDAEEKLVTNIKQDPETQVAASLVSLGFGMKTSASKTSTDVLIPAEKIKYDRLT